MQRIPDLAQHLEAADAAPALFGRWEPFTDVATPSGAEQPIDERMDKSVAVRVAGQATAMRNVDAAQPQRNAFRERVDIHTRTHTQHGRNVLYAACRVG